MFDIGMTELLVIGVVALIVVGPKDLPGMFRTLGRFTGKMKGMAREFQRAMDDAADESGVKTISDDLKGLGNPRRYGLDKLNEAAASFEKWEPGKSASSKGPETAKPGAERSGKAQKMHEAAASRAREGGEPAARPQGAPLKGAGSGSGTPATKSESDA